LSEVLYIDRLVRISETSITFFNYYYPSSKSLTVPFHNVKKVVSLMPTLLNGKYRLWGTSSGFQKILREARETRYLFCIEKIRE
jgi:hypothetical protein